LFCLAAAAVWYAGSQLTKCVDAIGDRRALSKAFLGFLVLATATQLPEVVTNSTAALIGEAELLLNSMFGGVSMQTAVLIVADAAAGRYALSYLSRSPATLLQAALLLVLLTLILAVAMTRDVPLPGAAGLLPIALFAAYLASIGLIWKLQQGRTWQASDPPPAVDETPDRPNDRAQSSMQALILRSLAATVFILVAGVLLVLSAQAIADQSGLGSSFIGVTLLATATSLPEASTTVTAVRLRQYGMAIADIFGSNMIMIALLLPSDLLFRQGILLNSADASARFALVLGILLTALYATGLVVRHPKACLRLGIDSWAVLIAYISGVVILYGLR